MVVGGICPVPTSPLKLMWPVIFPSVDGHFYLTTSAESTGVQWSMYYQRSIFQLQKSPEKLWYWTTPTKFYVVGLSQYYCVFAWHFCNLVQERWYSDFPFGLAICSIVPSEQFCCFPLLVFLAKCQNTHAQILGSLYIPLLLSCHNTITVFALCLAFSFWITYILEFHSWGMSNLMSVMLTKSFLPAFIKHSHLSCLFYILCTFTVYRNPGILQSYKLFLPLHTVCLYYYVRP